MRTTLTIIVAGLYSGAMQLWWLARNPEQKEQLPDWNDPSRPEWPWEIY